MQHDVESESKSHEEKRIPEQERKESLEDFVEHGDVDVVLGKPGVLGHQHDHLHPGEEDHQGGHVTLDTALTVTGIVRVKQEVGE